MSDPENIDDIGQLKKRLKEELKQKLKAELKKELLEEIYQELRNEEKEPEVEVKPKTISHKEEKKVAPKIMKKKLPKVKGDFQVEIAIKTILKISTHALKYANNSIPREKWVEVIGLLAGKYDEKNNILHLEDAYPMGHGNAIYAEIKDYKNYVRAFNDLKSQGYFIGGWYHSHPTYGLFMSNEDIGTQSRYQRLWDKSVALVVDPYMIDGKQYGFKLFQADLKKNNWFEVPYKIKGSLSAMELPELLEFINPIVDGKALYLEYDEE